VCEVQVIDMDEDLASSSRLDRVDGTFAGILVPHCLCHAEYELRTFSTSAHLCGSLCNTHSLQLLFCTPLLLDLDLLQDLARTLLDKNLCDFLAEVIGLLC